jgi:hypothetical protein
MYNHIKIDNTHRGLFFSEDNINSVDSFVEIKYHMFNILINLYGNDTVFKTLDNEFFDKLSTHKKKITFVCKLNSNGVISPLYLKYGINFKQMGIFVKKLIIREFGCRGIIIKPIKSIKKLTNRDNFTTFEMFFQ